MYNSRYISGIACLALALSLGVARGQERKQTDRTHQASIDSTDQERELKAKGYYYRGVLEASNGHNREAFALLRHSYGIWPSPETAFALSELYVEREEYTPLLQLREEAFKSDSTNREYMWALAMTYLVGENTEGAIALLEQWVKRNPDDEEMIERLGKTYFRSGEFHKAVKLYDQLLRDETQYPRYAQIHNVKVALLEASGDKGKANKSWQEFLQRFPDQAQARLAYIDWCLRSDMPREAELALQQAEQSLGSTDASLTELRIRLALMQRDYPKAEQLLLTLGTLPDAEVDDQLILWYKLIIEQKEGDKLPDQYNDRLAELVRRYPEHSNAYLTYGQVLRLQGRFADAIKAIRPLTKTDPENAEVWNSLIGDAISLGQEDMVRDLCLEAIKYVPSDWRYYFYGSIGLYTSGKKAEAKRLVEGGIDKLNEQDKEGRGHLLAQLGDLVSEEGDTIQSFRYYEKALENYPDNPSLLNNYAYALAERNQELDKAERMAAQGVKLQGDNANLLDTYAWIFYKRGKFSLAHLYQKKAIEASGDEPSAVMYDHLGDILLALEDESAALEAWHKAKELYTQEIKESESDKTRRKQQARLDELNKKIKKVSKK